MEAIGNFFSGLWSLEWWKALAQNITDHPIFKWLAILAIATFAIHLLFFILRLLGFRRATVLRIHTDNHGIVYLKQSALKNFIKKICRQVVPQANARVDCVSRFRKIRIKVTLSCPHDAQPVSLHIQQAIAQVLKHEIGISNLGRIDVVVSHIFGPVQRNFLGTGTPQFQESSTETRGSINHVLSNLSEAREAESVPPEL
ncbi:MAG: hypothetical protein K2L24_03390 [Opitutales bacterium]|nr:hypothetical protein [Opitutales bacterium]